MDVWFLFVRTPGFHARFLWMHHNVCVYANPSNIAERPRERWHRQSDMHHNCYSKSFSNQAKCSRIERYNRTRHMSCILVNAILAVHLDTFIANLKPVIRDTSTINTSKHFKPIFSFFFIFWLVLFLLFKFGISMVERTNKKEMQRCAIKNKWQITRNDIEKWTVSEFDSPQN